MWLEGSQTWKQVENGHLDEGVFTGSVFQHPPTHLDKTHNDNICKLIYLIVRRCWQALCDHLTHLSPSMHLQVLHFH